MRAQLPPRRLSGRHSWLVWFAAAVGVLLATPTAGYAEGGGASVSWGENHFMELGAGYKDTREERPVPVIGLREVVQLAAGQSFGLALLADGAVASWGGNAYGQLGDGSREDDWQKAAPHTFVSGLAGVRAVSAGGEHALALLASGEAMAWGTDQDGELGNGTSGTETERLEKGIEESGLTPKLVQGLANVTQVASGGGSNFALLSDGEVMAWGKNTSGQLGLGLEGPETCNTEVGAEACSTRPLTVMRNGKPLTGVQAISAGGEAAYALLKDGHVLSWGNNAKGQLGTGAENTRFHPPEAVKGIGGEGTLAGVTAISGGNFHALALLEDGTVAGWGANGKGDLGGASGETCGKVACDNVPRQVRGLKGISAISAGTEYSLALTGAGKVYGLGANNYGQLGDGAATNASSPKPVEGVGPVSAISAGNTQALALLASGVPSPPPLLAMTPGPHSLDVTWTVSPPEHRLRWKPAAETGWSPALDGSEPCSALAPCSRLISDLKLERYEVELSSYDAEGHLESQRLMDGAPER